jgi:hypothetical protein
MEDQNMSTVAVSGVDQIGEVAGLVWQTLNNEGPLSLAKLVKSIDQPRDLVMQAIGWLAREDKLEIDENSRGKAISLR